jgi:hypothetical protein
MARNKKNTYLEITLGYRIGDAIVAGVHVAVRSMLVKNKSIEIINSRIMAKNRVTLARRDSPAGSLLPINNK